MSHLSSCVLARPPPVELNTESYAEHMKRYMGQVLVPPHHRVKFEVLLEDTAAIRGGGGVDSARPPGAE